MRREAAEVVGRPHPALDPGACPEEGEGEEEKGVGPLEHQPLDNDPAYRDFAELSVAPA